MPKNTGDAAGDQGDGEPKWTNAERRLRQWAVGRADLPGTTTTLLQAILLHQKAKCEPCTAGVPTLALDIDASRSTIYDHLNRAVQNRVLTHQKATRRRSPSLVVTLRPGAEEEKDVRAMWRPGGNSDPVEKKWRRDRNITPPVEGRLRFYWARSVQRLSTLTTSARGVAWTASLFWNGYGWPFRKTSLDELSQFAGYGRDTVRTGLDELEAGGWIRQERTQGRETGGVALWPRLPNRLVGPLVDNRLRKHLKHSSPLKPDPEDH